MNERINDRELLYECRILAFDGRYSEAISKARKISNPEFSIRAELLVIELELSRKNGVIKNDMVS